MGFSRHIQGGPSGAATVPPVASGREPVVELPHEDVFGLVAAPGAHPVTQLELAPGREAVPGLGPDQEERGARPAAFIPPTDQPLDFSPESFQAPGIRDSDGRPIQPP